MKREWPGWLLVFGIAAVLLAGTIYAVHSIEEISNAL